MMVGLRGGGTMKTSGGATLKMSMAAASGVTGASIWAKVPIAPADPILGISEMFKKDERSHKVLLGVGAYRTDEGKPYILDCVKQAEIRILKNDMDHEYSPIDGIATYRAKAVRLGWGENS